MESLFIYGTLRKGYPNENILTNIGGKFTDSSVFGRYINVGWGVEIGCPALSLDPQGEEIRGQIFSSSHLTKHWEFLDEFEGSDYHRVETSVKLENGQMCTAFVYVAKE